MKIRKAVILLFCLGLLASTRSGAQDAPSGQSLREDAAADSTIRSALLAAGRNALKQGDLSGAVFYYSRYIQQQPDDVAAAVEFAGVLLQAGRFEEALEACEQALRNDPSNPEARRLKAVALGRSGRTDEALRVIEDLRARFPEDLDLQKIEAGLRTMKGDHQVRRNLYDELLRAGFNTTRDWQDYLQLLAADRQWDLLVKTHAAYRDRLTANDAVRFAVLQARLARNELPEAEALYSAMSSVDLRHDAALMIADQLASAGQLAAAIRVLESNIEGDDPDPNLVAKIALLEAYRKRTLRAMARIDSFPREKTNDRLDITRAKVLWAAGRPVDALAELDALNLPATHLEATLARAGLLYDLHREWEIPALLARISSGLQNAEAADRKLAWCLTILADIRSGDLESARRVLTIFRDRENSDLAPDILAILVEKAARREVAFKDAVVQLGVRLRGYRPGAELIRPALLNDVPAAAWRVAWSSRPTNPFSLLELAHASFRERDIPEAVSLYEKGLAIKEIRLDSMLGLAECARRMRDSGRVEQLAGTLLDSELDFTQLIAAARLMLKAGLDGLAEAFISRIAPDDRDHPDAVVVQSAWLICGKREAEARRLLAAIEPDDPVRVGILLYQARALADLAESPADPVGRAALEQALTLAALDSGTHVVDGALVAADILMRQDDYDRARDILERAEHGRPRDLRVRDRLMSVYIRLGLYQNAETEARGILARRPGDAERRCTLARMCVWQSDYQLAWRRYRELISDYPEDGLFSLEMAAKRDRALGRYRSAMPLYDAYADRNPADREMRVEAGDIRMIADFTKAAADIYRPASWAFPDDAELIQALNAAERRSNWGLFAQAGYEARKGHDNKVDVRQDRYEAGVRLPRGPDAMTLDVGIGTVRLRFDDERAQPLEANLLAASGRWAFTNGLDLAGGAEVMDYRSVKSTWRANVDLGYRGMEGWKVAAIAGRLDVRDNYYTILEGLQSSWLGAYGQWQPLERVELFGQYRMFSIDAPQPDALLPTNNFIAVVSTTTVTAPATNAPNPDTWKDNRAHEGVLEASYHILFFPHSLRAWVNGYLYNTEKENDMYWTPEDTFVAGQVGLHWRHTLGHRHFPGAPFFFYGAYVAIGKNSEGDNSPTVKGEIGWQNGGGWGFGAEATQIWGDVYEESSAHARLSYLF